MNTEIIKALDGQKGGDGNATLPELRYRVLRRNQVIHPARLGC